MADRTLGHYRILEKIGAGGMGVVYRAQDGRLGREVAIKVVGERWLSDEKARARLLQEARTASALNHPNVCTIHEVAETPETYIVMEYVAGRPLSTLVPAEGLPIEAVLRYAQQISDALAHAHQSRVIHRDLKSSNVVITADGRAKVLDFGLAKQLREQDLDAVTHSQMSLTEAGAVVGTLHSLAPEVLHGQPANERSDLWALGVMLYEMATGTLPFQGKTSFELTSGILHEPLAPLPERVPPGLRNVIQRCLAKEPGQRYQRAVEVRAALEALQHQTGVPVPSTAPKAPRRPWRWFFAAGLLLVGAGITAAVMRGGLFGPRRAPVEQPSPPPNLRTLGEPSANAEANEYFQKGILFLDTQFNVPRAHEMFERALAIDPDFAEARAAYGFTDVLMIEGGYSNDSALLYRAEEEERRALQNGPDIGQGRMALAAVYLLQGRKEMVAAELNRAAQLPPGSLPVEMWGLLYHRFNGDYGPAEELAKQMLSARPTFFPARTYLGEMLREQGKLPDAIREQEKVLEQDPTNILALCHLSRAYLDLGNPAKAGAALERVRPEDRKNYRVRLALALVLAREGKRVPALRAMDPEVEKYAGVHSLMNAQAAAFYAVLGEKGKALEWLDRAVRNGDERAEWFRRDPLLAGIRNELRFQRILESIAYRRSQRTSNAASAR